MTLWKETRTMAEAAVRQLEEVSESKVGQSCRELTKRHKQNIKETEESVIEK